MDEETRRPFVVKGPVSPTAAEVDEHEALGHVQFRNWCRHCIRAKAASNPHYRAPIQETGTPVISMDYAFMGMDDGATMPILVIKDQNTKYMWAGVMPAKGVSEYSLSFAKQAIQEAGTRKIVLKSDQEHAIVALKAEARRAIPEVEILMQESPVGDHQANGSIEVAIRELKKQVRVLKSSVEEKLGLVLDDQCPMLAWIPRHSAFLLSKFRVGEDGKTPEERRAGKRWRRPLIAFGERVYFRPVRTGNQKKNDFESKFMEGHYVGTNSRTAELLVMTKHGVVRGISFNRMPEEQRWSNVGFEELKGLPWNMFPREKETLELPLPVPLPEMMAAPQVVVVVEPAAPGRRRLYILKADIERYGVTFGCRGCEALLAGTGQARSHSEECRRRIEEMMARDDVGRTRLQVAQERRGPQTDVPEQERRPDPESMEVAAGEAAGAPLDEHMEAQSVAACADVPQAQPVAQPVASRADVPQLDIPSRKRLPSVSITELDPTSLACRPEQPSSSSMVMQVPPLFAGSVSPKKPAEIPIEDLDQERKGGGAASWTADINGFLEEGC